jgi:DNA polymerase III subunit delta'
MSICDVRHQPRAHRILQRAMASRRLPHAYIFHGPEGVGKQTLATCFARLLLCPRPAQADPPAEVAGQDRIDWREACGTCEDCTLTLAGTHPDMQMVYKELNRYHPAPEVRARKAIDLSVDVVRHFIIDRVGDKPARGRARVFVVLEADQMSVAAQNALLKTLEEPPDAAFIILVTRSLDRLLPTTLSRCQPVPFGALPSDFVEARLQSLRPDLADGPRRFVARYCDGRLGVAVRMADADLFAIKASLNEALVGLAQIGPSGFAQHIQEAASSLAEKYVSERVASGMIDKASEASSAEPTRRGLLDSLALASCLYRDVIQVGCHRPDEVTNGDQVALVKTLADRLTPDRAAQAIREIYRAETDVSNNANVPLAMEALAIRLGRLERPAAGARPLSARQEESL